MYRRSGRMTKYICIGVKSPMAKKYSAFVDGVHPNLDFVNRGMVESMRKRANASSKFIQPKISKRFVRMTVFFSNQYGLASPQETWRGVERRHVQQISRMFRRVRTAEAPIASWSFPSVQLSTTRLSAGPMTIANPMAMLTWPKLLAAMPHGETSAM
mmetsp:Transcript_117958/g.328689  ORF Transcript_117958/g.328689 Transcript_117958/m.328689 type:complete len:157 (+) Transcript_117958:592-1062(+)